MLLSSIFYITLSQPRENKWVDYEVIYAYPSSGISHMPQPISRRSKALKFLALMQVSRILLRVIRPYRYKVTLYSLKKASCSFCFSANSESSALALALWLIPATFWLTSSEILTTLRLISLVTCDCCSAAVAT